MKKFLPHVMIIAFFLYISLLFPVLIGKLFANIGWLHIVAIESTTEENSVASEIGRAVELFKWSSYLEPNSKPISIGFERARFLNHSYKLAYDELIESQLTVPDLANEGAFFVRKHRWNEALVPLRVGIVKSNLTASDLVAFELYYQAGNVCQSSYFLGNLLIPFHDAYCAEMFFTDSENLILNGAFELPLSYGWLGWFAFANRARSEVYQTSTDRSSSALIFQGKSSGNHKGLFQTIALPSGTRVRFTGRFKIPNDIDGEARLLYIGWQQNGEPQGNQAVRASASQNWFLLEREFLVPKNGGPNIQFYPVVLQGVGTVYVDDIQLTFIED